MFHGFAGWRIDSATFQQDANDDLPSPPDIGVDIFVWFRRMSPVHSSPDAPDGP